MVRIGLAGTDARTLLWAKEITNGENLGVVIRGNRAMEEYARLMNWPVEFIPTADNTARSLAEAGINAFRNGQLDYLLAQSENHYYDGFVDIVTAAGFGNRVAGLTQKASFIEGDKIKAKLLCREACVPVADECMFSDARDFSRIKEICCIFFDKYNGAVLKYPFSAGGKGARVITDIWQLEEVYRKLMEDYSNNYSSIFTANNRWPLLIESLMGGAEISFTLPVDDLSYYQILPTSMDYARRFPGPAGPDNPVTGGMGAISPHPMETTELVEMFRKTIADPFIALIKAKGLLRKCVLYFGCFVTVDGFGNPLRIRVSEINIRMGEPEVQSVVRLIKNPGEILLAMFENRLSEVVPDIRENTISLFMALVTGPGGPDQQKGYPWSYTRGEVLEIDFKNLKKNNIIFVPSGANFNGEKFLSDGTRVGYIGSNGKITNGNIVDCATALRDKLLNAYKQGKVRVIPRENPKGNRLDLRDDCGSEFIKYAKIFNSQ